MASWQGFHAYPPPHRVFSAANGELGKVAAIKLVFLTQPNNPALGPVQVASEEDIKLLKKEVQVHRTMKHVNVLEFMDSLLVDQRQKGLEHAVPGLYMLLEFAAGGDLFDKIGEPSSGHAPATLY